MPTATDLSTTHNRLWDDRRLPRGEGVPPLRREAILALLLCDEGGTPSKRGRDARDTQGQDALATRNTAGSAPAGGWCVVRTLRTIAVGGLVPAVLPAQSGKCRGSGGRTSGSGAVFHLPTSTGRMSHVLLVLIAILTAIAPAAVGRVEGVAPSQRGQDARDTKGTADSEVYLRYVHPTIREPFPDLVNLTVSAELEDQRTAGLGLVDVTKGPFRADPSGREDSTRALQAAIDFARDHQMVCFFPSGTYRISDTLVCTQQLYRRSNGRVLGANRFPNLLVGSRAGPQRPRLVLAPRSPGFDDPQKPKLVVHFWARGYANPTTAGRVTDGLGPEVEQPNISMNQMLVNLDIVIGQGNPGAVALRHQAAEGSAIEDCTIDATHGLAGIQGGIGSGGGS
ncbi:MAG: hypothetical protein FJ280_20670, partial [Planctomycetes bacterium]|nr:hypothetical protein [Planctomycetota bacterium]